MLVQTYNKKLMIERHDPAKLSRKASFRSPILEELIKRAIKGRSFTPVGPEKWCEQSI